MKRLKKAMLLTLRHTAYRWHRLRTYYWADNKLHELGSVYVLPKFYYRWLYHTCMLLAKTKCFRGLADRAMHTIPYHVRFHVA